MIVKNTCFHLEKLAFVLGLCAHFKGNHHHVKFNIVYPLIFILKLVYPYTLKKNFSSKSILVLFKHEFLPPTAIDLYAIFHLW